MMETKKTTAFDAEGMVWDYRFARDHGDAARVKRLCKEWAAWQGCPCRPQRQRDQRCPKC
jgi:hypothetical protein